MHVSVFSSKHRLKEHRNSLNTQTFTEKSFRHAFDVKESERLKGSVDIRYKKMTWFIPSRHNRRRDENIPRTSTFFFLEWDREFNTFWSRITKSRTKSFFRQLQRFLGIFRRRARGRRLEGMKPGPAKPSLLAARRKKTELETRQEFDGTKSYWLNGIVSVFFLDELSVTANRSFPT